MPTSNNYWRTTFSSPLYFPSQLRFTSKLSISSRRISIQENFFSFESFRKTDCRSMYTSTADFPRHNKLDGKCAPCKELMATSRTFLLIWFLRMECAQWDLPRRGGEGFTFRKRFKVFLVGGLKMILEASSSSGKTWTINISDWLARFGSVPIHIGEDKGQQRWVMKKCNDTKHSTHKNYYELERHWDHLQASSANRYFLCLSFLSILNNP